MKALMIALYSCLVISVICAIIAIMLAFDVMKDLNEIKSQLVCTNNQEANKYHG